MITENDVFIERASPITINGIRSMCCSDEEYKWYVKGLTDGRMLGRKQALEDVKTLKTLKTLIDEIIKNHEGLYLATKFDFNVSVTHQNFCIELEELKKQLKEC